MISFNIDKANLRYDKFITGSDQVFNFACTDFDKTYFLQFVIVITNFPMLLRLV